MRILHLMAPAPFGGAERVVLDLSRVLADRGQEVHLLPVLGKGEADHPFLDQVHAAVCVHPIWIPPRRYLLEWTQVRRLVKRIQPSVVHSHGYRADVVGAGGARRAGAPTVTTVHGFTGGGGLNRVYEWLQKRALRRFDAVVAVSRPLEKHLSRFGLAPERLHVIRNARPLPDDIPPAAEARRAMEVSQQVFHIGWVGRVSWEKGPDVMLEAAKRLLEKGPGRRVLVSFVGDGPERSRLEVRTRELGLNDRVRWLGRVPDALRLMPGFDALVLSSRTEGTPIVGLEAMGLGIPLVATRVGGVADLTGEDAALLVPSEQPEALAAALGRLLDDPRATERRRAAALDRVQEVASPALWAERYLEVYRSVAPRGEGGS